LLQYQEAYYLTKKGWQKCHPFFVPTARESYFFFFAGAFFAVTFFADPQVPLFALQAMNNPPFLRSYFSNLSWQQLSVNNY
jgi:hypothetical protein